MFGLLVTFSRCYWQYSPSCCRAPGGTSARSLRWTSPRCSSSWASWRLWGGQTRGSTARLPGALLVVSQTSATWKIVYEMIAWEQMIRTGTSRLVSTLYPCCNPWEFIILAYSATIPSSRQSSSRVNSDFLSWKVKRWILLRTKSSKQGQQTFAARESRNCWLGMTRQTTLLLLLSPHTQMFSTAAWVRRLLST